MTIALRHFGQYPSYIMNQTVVLDIILCMISYLVVLLRSYKNLSQFVEVLFLSVAIFAFTKLYCLIGITNSELNNNSVWSKCLGYLYIRSSVYFMVFVTVLASCCFDEFSFGNENNMIVNLYWDITDILFTMVSGYSQARGHKLYKSMIQIRKLQEID